MRRSGGRATVALFFWEGYLGVSPSVVEGIRCLAAHGWNVDVFLRVPAHRYPDPPEFPSNVRLLRFRAPSDYLFSRSIHRIEKRARPEGRPHSFPVRLFLLANKGFRRLFFPVDYLLYLMFCRRGRVRPDGAIGIDMYGIIPAKLAMRDRRPLLYWSLEIERMSDLKNLFFRLIKAVEIRITRKVDDVIIQDTLRAAALAEENNINLGRLILVPNAPSGMPRVSETGFFHRRLGLAPGQRIILHAGMINAEVCSIELAAAAARWPRDWTLVFHERVGRSPDEPFLRRLTAAGGDRVRLSLDPIPYDQLDNMYASADIGLVVYRFDFSPNMALMAAASGKLAYCLRNGLPVVCVDLPGIREIVDVYRCGAVVRDLSEIGTAIEKIMADRATYGENARRCYAERYEFTRHFAAVIAKIEEGMTAGPAPR